MPRGCRCAASRERRAAGEVCQRVAVQCCLTERINGGIPLAQRICEGQPRVYGGFADSVPRPGECGYPLLVRALLERSGQQRRVAHPSPGGPDGVRQCGIECARAGADSKGAVATAFSCRGRPHRSARRRRSSPAQRYGSRAVSRIAAAAHGGASLPRNPERAGHGRATRVVGPVRLPIHEARARPRGAGRAARLPPRAARP